MKVRYENIANVSRRKTGVLKAGKEVIRCLYKKNKDALPQFRKFFTETNFGV